MTTQFPESAYTETNGMAYFARMISKIRLFAAGQLPEDYHENLGRSGADGWCCSHLGVDYEALKAHVLANPNASNEAILDWCYSQGRPLQPADLFIWNGFMLKVGWNDRVTPRLIERKAESGLSDRDDIQTMPEYFEWDEGRKP